MPPPADAPQGPNTACKECGRVLPEGTVHCPYCTTETVDVPSDKVFPRIPGYRIRRIVGRGGMGLVFEAEEITLGRRVALKVLSRKLEEEDAAGAYDRFLREARAMAAVEHPHIVRIYAYGEAEGKPFIAMQYVEGEDLADYIRRKRLLPVKEAFRILGQTIDALEEAWEKGIIHRDIKPSNIMLDEKLKVLVADFGLAKSLMKTSDNTLTQSGHVLGSPHYISPEQLSGLPVDFRADIYALGIVLFEMLTGRRPFDGPTPFAIVGKHLNDPLPRLSTKTTELSKRLQMFVDWMTRKRADERPASYAELRTGLAALLDATGKGKTARATHASQAGSRRAGRREGKRSAVLLALAGILGCAIVLGGVVALLERDVISSWFAPERKEPAIEAIGWTTTGIEEFRSPKDGARMVRVPDSGFLIDAEEVTVARYLRFCSETGRAAPSLPSWSGSDHPMVRVTWGDADAFCRWAGKRLPAEAEWEQAARGGRQRERFPWGDAFRCDMGSFDDEILHDPYHVPGEPGCDGYTETAPVGSFPANAYSLHDMAGNVWEWCADPLGGGAPEAYRIARGGSWANPLPDYFSSDARNWYEPGHSSDSLGFRCAADP